MRSGTIWDRVNSLGTFSSHQLLVRVTDAIDIDGEIGAAKFVRILEEEWLQDLEPREQPEMTAEERYILFGPKIPELEERHEDCGCDEHRAGCETGMPPHDKEGKVKCWKCGNEFVSTVDGHCECGAKLEEG